MRPSEPLEGRIGRTYQDSEPWWPLLPEDEHGPHPNVLIVLPDDTGFAHLGCDGSTIDTHNLGALAAATAALRSPEDQVSHMGSNCSPCPSHAWCLAAAGTFM